MGPAATSGVRGDVPALRGGRRRIHTVVVQHERSYGMPYIEVKAFDRRIDDESARRIIQELTDGLCAALGEEVREATWVVVTGVPSARWGIGGRVSA
jgi:4-oxalocrotonate tautomerase